MTIAIAEWGATQGPVVTDVLAAIGARRSVGRVRPERPPQGLIAQLLEPATWAPNHRLTEPWRFIVLAGGARRALGEVVTRSLAATLPSGAPDRQAQLDKARGKPLRTPVVIAVAVEPQPGQKVVEIEEVLAGGAAVQNLLLAAHALGWGRSGAPASRATTRRSRRSSASPPAPTFSGSSTSATRTARRRGPAEPPRPPTRGGAAGTMGEESRRESVDNPAWPARQGTGEGLAREEDSRWQS